MPARLAAGTLVAIACAIAPAPAFAHDGNPNFRSDVHGLEPPVAGVDVEILNYDDSLRLRSDGRHAVLVEGYEHEPYIRIGRDGTVEVNERSPSYYLNQDRFAAVDVPATADPDAPPAWTEVDRTGQYVWHDHRAHYMSKGTPPQVEDESERTKVFDYSIPLRIDGERERITGTLFWVGQDDGVPLAPFLALGAVVAAALALFLVRRRRRDGPKRSEAEAW
jgi:hypothetical protein